MSDLSEQQVLMADSAAGTKQQDIDREKSRIREFMDALFQHVSEEDRVLLTLKEVEGLSLKELERVYKINENALKVRLFRARQRVLKAHKQAVENGEI
jgi:RNA polymerase sigma-70 factor (ECF subfamily)